MANNSEPFEILAGPAEVWVAPEGTPFPDVDTDPPSPWAQIASALNIPEGGVTIATDGEVVPVYSLGGTGSRKGFRTRQELHARFSVMDATAEAYAAALNDAAIDTDAAASGTPGTKRVELAMPGGAVATRAVLVRVLQSPEGDALNSQWEFPRAYNMGNPETVYTKGEPVALEFDYVVMDDDDGNKGSYVVQTAAAL